MPSFYTDVKEISGCKKSYFAFFSTVNIPEEMEDSAELLKSAKYDELQWLDFVAEKSEAASNIAWSAYHSQKGVSSTRTKSVNAILPLLPQNIRYVTLGMQKHCIEVTSTAIEFLNPGQITLDVNDHPVYALSKKIQLLYPDEFGPGKYFPMFGELHIEKVFLIIHGQLVEGSGLSDFLDVSDLSIIGAEDVLIKVPSIRRSRYLLEVFLCAEFKTLKEVYLKSELEHGLL